MFYRKVIILLCFIFKVSVQVEIKNNCVNNSEIFLNSLNFLNYKNLFEKWKIGENRSISELCSENLNIFIDNISNGSVWAIKMLDASGHYEGKLFNGNGYWLGSNSQCQDLNALYNKYTTSNITVTEYLSYRRTYENRIVSNDSEQIDIFSVPPFPVKFAAATVFLKLNQFCQLHKETGNVIYIGFCIPSSCNEFDTQNILGSVLNSDFMEIKRVRMIPGKYAIWEDLRFYLLSLIVVIMTLLITLATCFDIIDSKYCQKFRVTLIYRILHAFSIIENAKIIGSLDVGEDTLAPIHGLKLISMIWVVMLHTCLIVFQVSGNKTFRDKSESEFLYQTISNGQYSVDTFFTVSGVLVSFLFFRKLSKHPVKKLIGIGGSIGHSIFYILMLLFRLARLSVPYLFVILLTGFLTEQRTNYSAIFLPNMDNINCVNYWWRNALYINTFYPSVDMCMSWSWYLANDTQFFVLGIPLLLLALRWRVASLILGSICVVLANVITAVISYQKQHIIDVKDPFAHYDDLYDKPWVRIAPYFIGMATGWFLFNKDCKLKISKILNTFLWLCSLSSMLFIIYGPVYFVNQLLFGSFYTSLSHSVWSFAVSWTLIACVTGNGYWINNILSWKYMYPLSRLSYCTYLIHPLLIRMVLLSSETPIFISVEIIMVLFFGFLVLSLIAAAVLSLTFESPVVALLRLGSIFKKPT